MRVAFLGLGLIGGSIALAIRSSQHSVVAWSPRGDGPREALANGVIETVAARPDEAIREADLVVLAAPPLACLELLEWLGAAGRPALAPGVTVTDVASTKTAITQAARRAKVAFVGGHPMAGRERAGFAAADRDLFRDRPWVITEAIAGGDVERVRALAAAAGARPVAMVAADHDRAVAAISHLPLVASVALVEAVLGTGDDPGPDDLESVRGLAASGWRDMTRLALGDPAMGSGIAVTNAAELAARLRAYRDRLDAWLAELERAGGPDPARIQDALAAARRRLDGREP